MVASLGRMWHPSLHCWPRAAPRRVAPVFLACFAVSGALRAQGHEAAARMAWVRGEGAGECPDGPGLAQRLVAILGRDPFGPAPSQFIEGVVERRDGRWVARLFVRTAGDPATASREFTDESRGCEVVATSVALAMALSIDPGAALRAPDAPPPPAAPPPPSRPPTRPRRPHPPAAREVGAAVEVRAVGLLGLLPGLTPGVALAGEPFVRGRLRLLLAGLYAPETRTDRFGARFAFGLSAFTAAGCVDVAVWNGGAVAGCAGVALGAVHSVVFDLLPYAPGDRLWAGVQASARLTVRIVRPLVAVAGVDAWALPLRARFHLERREDVVFEQGAFALTGHFGLGVSFR